MFDTVACRGGENRHVYEGRCPYCGYPVIDFKGAHPDHAPAEYTDAVCPQCEEGVELHLTRSPYDY